MPYRLLISCGTVELSPCHDKNGKLTTATTGPNKAGTKKAILPTSIFTQNWRVNTSGQQSTDIDRSII